MKSFAHVSYIGLTMLSCNANRNKIIMMAKTSMVIMMIRIMNIMMMVIIIIVMTTTTTIIVMMAMSTIDTGTQRLSLSLLLQL